MSNLNKEIQGYLPYWIDPSEYSKIRMDLLTTICWFSVTPNIDGNIIKYQNYPPTALIKSAHDGGVKVVLVLRDENVNSINSSDIIDRILSDSTVRANLINNVAEEIRNNNFDGVEIDLENSRKINSINGQPNKTQMTDFITQLADSLRYYNSNSRVSVAVGSVDWNDIWDVGVLQNVVNYVLIMGYDYYGGSWTDTSGPNAPIDVDNPTGPSIRNSINTYSGLMNKNKILLGVPYYGYKWSTIDNTRLSPKMSSSDTAIGILYKDIIIMPQISDRVFDNVWQTPWLAYQSDGKWYQIHYDDTQSLGIKYDLVKSINLAGIGIWALDYDYGRDELWELIQQKFVSIPVLTTIITTPSKSSINIGATQQLTVTCKDHNNNTMTCPTLTWSSSNTKVAIVSTTGLVTGVSLGSVNITVSTSGKSSVTTIVVLPVANRFNIYDIVLDSTTTKRGIVVIRENNGVFTRDQACTKVCGKLNKI